MSLHRREFMQAASGAALALHTLGGQAQAEGRLVPSMLHKLLTTPSIGFPTVTPVFAAAFVPGPGGVTMVFAETFASFMTQVQAQSNLRLGCFTTIQNMNRTWFYGALVPGKGAATLLRTADPSAFQQMFTSQQGSATLVDFNIAWELGQLYYTGYWLASSSPKKQMLVWDVNFTDLGAQWNTLSSNGYRMSRVQAFPQQDSTSFSALFETGSGGYALYDEPFPAFVNDATTKFPGITLTGIDFDPVSGNMVGCWENVSSASQFVSNQDWPTLMATVQQSAAAGLTLQCMTAYPNSPSFDDYFATNLAPFTAGYAYAVAKDGVIIGSGGGYGRLPSEAQNPGTPFTPDTRFNLASVSKALCGITLEVLCQMYNLSLDAPFWPLVQKMVPNPHPSVKVVTLRNLATMMSGMVQEANEGPISPPPGFTFWSYIASYLAQPLVATPGVTYYYDNTNFSIMQGVIEQVSGMDYVSFFAKYVLTPAGMNPSIVNATPDPQSTAALTYSGPNDNRPGYYWGPIGFLGPAGMISSARELVKLLAAMRGTSVLPASVISEMFADGIGWYTNIGNFGTYYQHNGSIGNGLNPSQRLNTAFVHLGEGYDCVLLSDSIAPADVVTLVIGAFDSRGVPIASLPTNGPSIASVVHGASFLPNVAPGAFVSIIGSGFTTASTDWTATIGGGSQLPIEVQGVQVRVNNQNAYVEYVSPTQINFLLPLSALPGLANVELTTLNGGMTSSVQINAVAPGLFAYTLNGVLYPAAVFASTTTYVAAVGALPGYASRPAAAGDIIEVYGTGMGQTSPLAPDGEILTQAYPANLANFAATVGGVSAKVLFAGMVYAGAFQIDVQIPAGLKGGNQPISLTVNGVAIQPNLMIAISA
jgi:uncharacterized protein (TIGR03437 family)